MTEPSSISRAPSIKVEYNGIDEAFPKADPGLEPYGHRVLVQIRTPKRQTAGGIYVPEESRETELWNTQVAKVIRLGPVAFKNRETLEPWPEGEWCKPGVFVRTPKYGGDRWQVPLGKGGEFALFVLFTDHDLIGEILGDPLAVVAFL